MAGRGEGPEACRTWQGQLREEGSCARTALLPRPLAALPWRLLVTRAGKHECR
jgi:hypothetical protein